MQILKNITFVKYNAKITERIEIEYIRNEMKNDKYIKINRGGRKEKGTRKRVEKMRGRNLSVSIITKICN